MTWGYGRRLLQQGYLPVNKKCEMCCHKESQHRIIKDKTGEHLYCDKCKGLCF